MQTGRPVSAVPGMTLPEVRKALGKIRQMWAEATPENPLFISTILVGSNTIAEFCTRFVYNHHIKRHLKSAHQRAQLAEMEEAAGTYAEDAATTAPSPPKGVQGPKGDDKGTPFPFTPGWMPSCVPVDVSVPCWWTPTAVKEEKEQQQPKSKPSDAAPVVSAPKPPKPSRKRVRKPAP
jgi:hypothetical protein